MEHISNAEVFELKWIRSIFWRSSILIIKYQSGHLIKRVTKSIRGECCEQSCIYYEHMWSLSSELVLPPMCYDRLYFNYRYRDFFAEGRKNVLILWFSFFPLYYLWCTKFTLQHLERKLNRKCVLSMIPNCNDSNEFQWFRSRVLEPKLPYTVLVLIYSCGTVFV